MEPEGEKDLAILSNRAGVRSSAPHIPALRISSPLARERHQPLLSAPRASEPREPGCEAATGQEILKRTLNKLRQARPVTMLRCLCAKCLVVLAHNLMQRALLGPTRAIVE